MKIQRKSMNWFTKQPIYKQVQAIREQNRARTASFEAANSAAGASFAAAQQNLFAGLASLVAQATISRTESEIQATIKSAVDKLA